VSENRVLRRIFGCKRDRKLENIAQCGASQFVPLAKYYYSDQIKEDEMVRECSTHGSKVF
jgi:hypothetical protein